jgi:hypothetical protein
MPRETTPSSLITDRTGKPALGGEATGPDQGVIEEARRRQRLRRLRCVLAGSLVALVVAALAWVLGGGAAGATRGGSAAIAGRAVNVSDGEALGFNVRLVPTLSVGRVGWCVVPEEHGVADGDACGGAALASRPFLQIFGWGIVGSGHETSVAVTTPEVAAVMVDSHVRVTPSQEPGLPYGLRAVRVVSRVSRGGTRSPRQTTIVALDAEGRRIPDKWQEAPPQSKVQTWRAPAPAPRRVCRLRAAGMQGLLERGGQIATGIAPFPGVLAGDAFVACIDVEYRLRGIPIDAEILLDAAHPGVPPAALPDWKPVPRALGFFSEGGLMATRVADAWLLVRQGSGPAERLRLLRHLSATVDLRRWGALLIRYAIYR